MPDDPRIRVSLPHLRRFRNAAQGLGFLPRQPARSVLNGQHASRLRGRGLNFEEMRDYQPGDDIRSIDWKATARTGKPHVRVFTEERDRPALLVVDQRMSMFFGSVLNMKSVTAAEAAAIAAFRILDAGDRVGGIVFDDERQLEFVPKRSRRGVFTLLESLATMNGRLSADKPVDARKRRLNEVLERVARIAHHDHLVVVLSDFAGIDATTEQRLRDIAAHNDLVLALVSDPAAEAVLSGQRAIIGDSRMQAEIDLSSAGVGEAIAGFTSGRLAEIRRWQDQINLSVLPLSSGQETLPQIMALLGAGAARRKRA